MKKNLKRTFKQNEVREFYISCRKKILTNLLKYGYYIEDYLEITQVCLSFTLNIYPNNKAIFIASLMLTMISSYFKRNFNFNHYETDVGLICNKKIDYRVLLGVVLIVSILIGVKFINGNGTIINIEIYNIHQETLTHIY